MLSSDAVRAELHRKAIENIVNEMALTLVRTSGSPVVTDAKDFSTCLLDEHGEQLGLSSYVLLHSSSAWLNTRAVIDRLAADGVAPRPGDGWIVNDPYVGGSQHQGDVAIVMPIFAADELAGWAFSDVHVLDIGGMSVSGVAPGAKSVYDEALRFGAIRVIRDGVLDEEWKRYIAQNVRAPGPVLNDLRSLIAANNVAAGKLRELVDRVGLEDHRTYNEEAKRLTEDLLRRRIAAMRDGDYHAIEYIEYDPGDGVQLVEVRCALTVDGSDLRFAYSGDPQVDAPLNATRGTVYGSVMTHLLTMLSYGDLPFNAGMWRPITIDLGEPGTVVNATSPAPVSMAHAEPALRCGKAARHVLNQAAALSSDPVLRGRVGGMASEAYAAARFFGRHENGAPSILVFMDAVTGAGGGAQTPADGQDMYGNCTMAGAGVPDVEVHEAAGPVVFLWRRVAPNSGGPGQRRGGQGLDEAYVLHGTYPFAGSATGACAEFPPPGAGGGFPPSTRALYPIRATPTWTGHVPHDEAELGGTAEPIPTSIGRLVLEPGDAVRAVGGGGSGLGDPLLRAPELVARDVRDGYVTVAHAAEAYGVIVAPDGTLDATATADRRRAVRRDRIGATPEREAVAPEVPGLAVGLRDGAWVCASCDEELAADDEDWRAAAVRDDVPVASLYERLGMRVRERTESPGVLVVRYYCPACAGCLATDVVSDRAQAAPPVLAAATAVV